MKQNKAVDLSALFESGKYEGKWVALTKFAPEYEVICSGKDATRVHDKALKKGYKDPVLFKVSPQLLNAIF